ncbi:hypothetical protein X749_30065 [Mesorhizobium sp. LNJC391B00]|nr:hypothetical protein X749_30065 [Mesorhizobium sp. LNJC391B00]
MLFMGDPELDVLWRLDFFYTQSDSRSRSAPAL